MDLTYTTILVLASMMFVLTGMMGYLYWQHMRLHQGLQSLALVVSSIVNPPTEPSEEPDVPTDSDEAKEEADVTETSEDKPKEDDRVSVVDVDDLQSKTANQLRELLDKRGIPYGKRDSKTSLIELLKASS